MAFIIPLIPSALIIYFSIYLTTQYLGIILLMITIALGIYGLLRGNMVPESLFVFIAILIVTILDEGYIPFLMHTELFPISSNGLPIINISIAFVEYSLVLAQLSDFVYKYKREFEAKGYDKNVINKALSALASWTLALTTIALLVSLMLYLVFMTRSIYLIDPFTALLIFTIAYLVIMRYLYSKIQASTSE